MNQRDRDYDELLRRALRASADSVVPAEDGLERIRARLSTPHPLLVAWMMAGFSEVASRAAAGLQSVSDWLRPMPGAARERLRVTRPGPRPGGLARLRPTAVLAIAVFVVAGGALALTPLPGQAISQTAALIRSLRQRRACGRHRRVAARRRLEQESVRWPRNREQHRARPAESAAGGRGQLHRGRLRQPSGKLDDLPQPACQRRPNHRLPEPHWQPRAELHWPGRQPCPGLRGSPGPEASPSPSGSPALGPTGSLAGAANPIVSPDQAACPSPAASPTPSPTETDAEPHWQPDAEPGRQPDAEFHRQPDAEPGTTSPTPSSTGSSTPSPASSSTPSSTDSPSPDDGSAPSSTGSPSPAG